MNERLLRDSVEALIELRAELRSIAKDSVIETLDEVIKDLRSAQSKDSNDFRPIDGLKILGNAFELIPAIADLIKLLSGTK